MLTPSQALVDQNEPVVLERLAAQRQLYMDAKWYGEVGLYGSVVIAIVSWGVRFVWPGAPTALAGLMSIIWLSIDLLMLRSRQEAVRRLAAAVQEEVDYNVLGLRWNEFLAKRPMGERIAEAAARYGTDLTKLRDWYPARGSLPWPLHVLACQRANLSWDARLRRLYSDLLFAMAFGLVVVGLMLGLLAREDVNTLLLWMLPTLPALIETLDGARKHRAVAAEKESLHGEIERLWAEALTKSGDVEEGALRGVQDRILLARGDAPVLPEKFYWRFQAAYEKQMRDAADLARDEATRRLKSSPPDAKTP